MQKTHQICNFAMEKEIRIVFLWITEGRFIGFVGEAVAISFHWLIISYLQWNLPLGTAVLLIEENVRTGCKLVFLASEHHVTLVPGTKFWSEISLFVFIGSIPGGLYRALLLATSSAPVRPARQSLAPVGTLQDGDLQCSVSQTIVSES